MKVPNGVTYDKIADGCDGMAGKLTDTERELTFRFERAEGETELFAKVAGLGKGRGQLRELGRILCFTDN